MTQLGQLLGFDLSGCKASVLRQINAWWATQQSFYLTRMSGSDVATKLVVQFLHSCEGSQYIQQAPSGLLALTHTAADAIIPLFSHTAKIHGSHYGHSERRIGKLNLVELKLMELGSAIAQASAGHPTMFGRPPNLPSSFSRAADTYFRNFQQNRVALKPQVVVSLFKHLFQEDISVCLKNVLAEFQFVKFRSRGQHQLCLSVLELQCSQNLICSLQTGGGKTAGILSAFLGAEVAIRKSNLSGAALILVIVPMKLLLQEHFERFTKVRPDCVTLLGANSPFSWFDFSGCMKKPETAQLLFCTPEYFSKQENLQNELRQWLLEGRVSHVFFDEAHELLDVGFRRDFEFLSNFFQSAPVDKTQVVLLSATLDGATTTSLKQRLGLERRSVLHIFGSVQRSNLVLSTKTWSADAASSRESLLETLEMEACRWIGGIVKKQQQQKQKVHMLVFRNDIEAVRSLAAVLQANLGSSSTLC